MLAGLLALARGPAQQVGGAPATGVPAGATQLRQRSASFPEGTATIDHLLLHFDPESANEWLPACRDLVRAMPAAVQVTIAVHGPEEHALLERLFAAARLGTPNVVEVGRSLTPWARDRLLAVGDGSRVDLLTPRLDCVGPSYAGDVATADVLADRSGARSIPLALDFEGGDLECSAKFAFVGWGTILANAPGGRTEDAIRGFERLLRTDVVVVGRPAPPHDHLDMYLTVLDEHTVALGDPLAGAALLAEVEAEAAGTGVELPGFDAWTEAAQRSMASCYDDVLRDLLLHGLTVLRVPILHGEEGGVLTWNNALVERRGDEHRIYLPVYGVPTLDDAASRVYRGAGFRVFPIDVARIAASGGTVRCITNVIGWSAAVRPAPAR
ncbi:MAG: hypothetical protein KDE27_18545 [Planctomycetes bacterium]|nr:hypothetical protein [Planctomycetota bacterium]